MFLTAEQLQELTGRTRVKAQASWLRERSYPFEIDANGKPKVLRTVVESRLGGSIERKPQLRLTA